MHRYLRSLFLVFSWWCITSAGALSAADFDALKKKAEQAYAEKSFSQAKETYTEAAKLPLDEADRKWVAFRLADLMWRIVAGSGTGDPLIFAQAREALDQLIHVAGDLNESAARKPKLWMQVKESLGDSFWLNRHQRDWGQAWNYYALALDWWAGQPITEESRAGYLSIVRKASLPPDRDRHYSYGAWGNQLPLEVVENALKISTSAPDRSYYSYLLAITLEQQSHDPHQRLLAEKAYREALQNAAHSDWLDDVLNRYAQMLISPGRLEYDAQGMARYVPDFPLALSLYERILKEFRKEETPHHDHARNQIEEIRRTQLMVQAYYQHLPNQSAEFLLNSRNVTNIQIKIYALDLTTAIKSTSHPLNKAWIDTIDLPTVAAVWSTNLTASTSIPHQQENRTLKTGNLPAGAYLVHASSEGVQARGLLLMTDVAVVVKQAEKQQLIWVTDARTGAPVSQAQVTLYSFEQDRRNVKVTRRSGVTNPQGVFEVEGGPMGGWFVAVKSGDRQTFTEGHLHWNSSQDAVWKIHTVTDRAALRPGEKIQWKIVARRFEKDRYTTPANSTLTLQLRDPRGTIVKTVAANLNAFGSAWGEFDTAATQVLGEYQVEFLDADKQRHLGQSVLFRLEEYKLPEFKVSVEPANRPKEGSFVLGDTIEMEVKAEYYFGGPVGATTAEVFVFQQPHYRVWHPDPRYGWLYQEPQRGRFSGEQEIMHRSLQTDADGRLRFSFPTSPSQGQEVRFRIEVRATDVSRREIVGSSSLVVGRQPFVVHATPLHRVHKPGDQIAVKFLAKTSEDQPIATKGNVRLQRDTWKEFWVSPQGKEITGLEFRRMQREGKLPVNPTQNGWRLKQRGYESTVITNRTLQTSIEGEAQLNFVGALEGIYRISWTTPLSNRPPVTAHTEVWVATDAPRELHFQTSGVSLLVDKSILESGETLQMLAFSDRPDRHLLWGVQGSSFHTNQVVKMEGEALRLSYELQDRDVPNIQVSLFSVLDFELAGDTQEIKVPPVAQFLNVELIPNGVEHRPGSEGEMKIVIKDRSGKPVSAEVAVGVADQALDYIQKDYSPDPRTFFHGDQRPIHSQTISSLTTRRFQLNSEEEVAKEGEIENEKFLGAREMPAPQAMRKNSAASSAAKSSIAADSSVAPRQRGAENNSDEAEITVRNDFRSALLWSPSLVTDARGEVQVKWKYPDNLTAWTTKARAITQGAQVGQSQAITRTRKPLQVRLQGPRFLVAGDEAVVTGIVENFTEQSLNVRLRFTASALQILSPSVDTLELPPGAQKSVEWKLKANSPSLIEKLQLSAKTSTLTDAVEMLLPVHEHGIEKLIARGGKLNSDKITLKLQIPKERRKESTSLEIKVTPSLAATLLDSLPYLIEYPYGCTEQTMSRFLPAALINKTLVDLGLDPKEVAERSFGDLGDTAATHPKGKRSLTDLQEMIRSGLDRLGNFQHDDGGWGWWKDGPSDHWMTAYVVWGLSLAAQSNMEVPPSLWEKGWNYLQANLVEAENNPELQTWMLHALSYPFATQQKALTPAMEKAFAGLFEKRGEAQPYMKALLAISAHRLRKAEAATTLIKNLETGLSTDNNPSQSALMEDLEGGSPLPTAHWGATSGWSHWTHSGVESTAMGLEALLLIDPDHRLVEPVMTWLVQNRRGAQWSNTRDTAMSLLSLNHYLRVRKELSQPGSYTLTLNGKQVAQREWSAKEVLRVPTTITLGYDQVRDGENTIQIRKPKNAPPLFYASHLRYFSQEEPIAAAGNLLFLRREIQHLKGVPTLLKGTSYEKEAVRMQGIPSNDRLEVTLLVEAKNDLEYVVVEDLRAAGLESVEIRSGQSMTLRELRPDAVVGAPAAAIAEKPLAKSSATAGRTALEKSGQQARLRVAGPSRPVLPPSEETPDPLRYTQRTSRLSPEWRDRHAAFFISKLPQGVWEIRYTVRAETPGLFHHLPVLAHAMYVPEIRANGNETRIEVLK